MMATTLVPPSPSPAPAPSASGEVRFVAVRASLMPDEVLSARQVLVVRKQVLLGLVAMFVLLVAWYGLSWWQTRSANSDLASAQRQGILLQSQQNQYTPLVQAQADISNIRTQLQEVMVGDLSWKTMISAVRDNVPAGISVTSIAGDLSRGSGSEPGDVLNQTGSASVGQLSIQGSAPEKRTVAAYADYLAKVPGLTAPLISSVQSNGTSLTFTISAVITSDALGGKYATASAGATTPAATGGN
jgi:Tfp pilus assembly protein PilN